MSDELDRHQDVLPGDTATAWRRLAPVVPDWMYLSGGTALAIHLHHRVSRDLDLFTEQPFDAWEQERMLTEMFDDFAATAVTTGTVNGVLGSTKVQFLDASPQRVLVEPTSVAGIRVTGVEDILATKLKVVGDRGALRDYFDLMQIERQTDLDTVTGMRFFVERYRPRVPDESIQHILLGLGYFGDVDDDPGLPIGFDEIAAYWRKRQPQIVRALGLR